MRLLQRDVTLPLSGRTRPLSMKSGLVGIGSNSGFQRIAYREQFPSIIKL